MDPAKCRHVYEDVLVSVCPDCGKDAHTIDWKKQSRLHQEWIAQGKAEWSKCPVEGGTLRGWWSI